MSGSSGETTGVLAALSDQLAGAVERAGQSIVRVEARRRQPASGVVWSADGVIVTADHVLEREEDLLVGLPNGDSATATIVGRDAGTDPATVLDDAGTMDAGGDQAVPAQSGALFSFLQQGGYRRFEAESAPHPSSVHRRVRTFVNSALATSLAQGGGDHPVGAAAVKELFDGDGRPGGWAVSVKLAQTGDDSDWYWYETRDATSGDEPTEGRGVAACSGCHMSGTDFVLVRYPLL